MLMESPLPEINLKCQCTVNVSLGYGCPQHLHLHLEHLADVLLQSDLQPFIHTFTHRWRSQPRKATAGQELSG